MDNWLALYISLVWYCEITPEQALSQIFGAGTLNYKTKNIETIDIKKIEKRIHHKKFINIDKLEREYKISRHDMRQLITEKGQQILDDKINNQTDKYKKRMSGSMYADKFYHTLVKNKNAKVVFESLQKGQNVKITNQEKHWQGTVIQKTEHIVSISCGRTLISISVNDFISDDYNVLVL